MTERADPQERTTSRDNVVPIGTRGRPGRGGRSTPSSAARSLAGTPGSGGARTRPARPRRSAREVPHVVDVPDEVVPPVADTAPGPDPSTRPPDPLVEAVADVIDGSGARPDPMPDEDRAPGATSRSKPRPGGRSGIPFAEILGALTASAQAVLGEDWETRGASLLGQLRRRVTGDYAIDDFGLDPDVQAIVLGALRPLAEKWFRVEVRGAENIPSVGGALVVANHSGTIPLDAAITGLVVHDHAGRNLRMLGADLVFSLPFVGELARKTGATLACTEDAERLLTSGHIAGVWPEGFKGIGKPYAERYKLQRFGRGGFVSSAMRAGVPIVPVSIVGAEEIYPLIGNLPSVARLLGVPYIPITPFFPLLGLVGLIPLPSKWIIEFGEPIRTDAYSQDAADDPMLVFNVTDQVRETIQQTLYSLLVDRGHPFA